MPRRTPDPERREATRAEKEAIEITLDWLKERVVEDEDTGCWVWQGFITKGGQPQCRITPKPKVTATMLVRRLVAKMVYGDKKVVLQGGRGGQYGWAGYSRHRQAGVKSDCLHGCCHPDHVVMRTKTQAMQPTRGKPLSFLHKNNISRARRKNSRISDETIQQILRDPRPGNIVSEELGVHPSYVPHVRTGKLRVYSSPGRVFLGLMAPSNGEFYDEEKTA